MFRARLAFVLIVTAAACYDAARLTAPPEADRSASLGAIVPAGGSIQAATGMFYLAVVMAMAAEFSAKVYFFAG